MPPPALSLTAAAKALLGPEWIVPFALVQTVFVIALRPLNH